MMQDKEPFEDSKRPCRVPGTGMTLHFSGLWAAWVPGLGELAVVELIEVGFSSEAVAKQTAKSEKLTEQPELRRTR